MLFHPVLLKLTTSVVIVTGQTCQFSRFLLLPSACVAYYLPGLEQLLKCQLGVWVAPYNQLTL